MIARDDSDFCQQCLFVGERQDVGKVIGVTRSARLHRIVMAWETRLEMRSAKTREKQRAIRELRYAADHWDQAMRIVTRL